MKNKNLLNLILCCFSLSLGAAETCNFQNMWLETDIVKREKMQDAMRTFSAVLRETAYQMEGILAEKEERKKEKETVLENLRKNIKDYPEGLLSLKKRLTEHLEAKAGQAVSVEILADVLEITHGEEAWRGAVEGYLHTQKVQR